MRVSYFLQQLINGLQLGFVYALIALGYTMVYGIVRLINFAHGDVFMVGAYVGFYALASWKLPWPLAIVAAMAGCAVLGHRDGGFVMETSREGAAARLAEPRCSGPLQSPRGATRGAKAQPAVSQYRHGKPNPAVLDAAVARTRAAGRRGGT